jgi:hypothetical protein
MGSDGAARDRRGTGEPGVKGEFVTLKCRP